MKKVEVLVRIDPAAWLNKDMTSNLDFLVGRLTQSTEATLNEAVIKRCLKEIKLPKITITPKEIKSRMLDILAERALKGNEE